MSYNIRIVVYSVGITLFNMELSDTQEKIYRYWKKYDDMYSLIKDNICDDALRHALDMAHDIVTEYYWMRIREVLGFERVSEE